MRNLVLLIAVLVFVGCARTPKRVEQTVATAQTAVIIRTAQAKSDSGGLLGLQKIASIQPRKIPLKVEGNDNDLVRKVEGEIARLGFKLVVTETPFVTVDMDCDNKLFNKYASYYVYKGQLDLSVRLNREYLLAREQITAMSERVVGEDNAKREVIKKLTSEVLPHVNRSCNKVIASIASTEIVLDAKVLQNAFGTSVSGLQRKVDTLVNTLSGKTGIITCRLLENNWEIIKIHIMYIKDVYPSGIIYEYIEAKDFKKIKKIKDTDKQVEQFISLAFKASSSTQSNNLKAIFSTGKTKLW